MSLLRYLVDSNILLRFFTGEPHSHFLAAKELVENAEKGAVLLEIPALVVAETIYTLESFYKHQRRDVARVLSEFLRAPGIRLLERDRVLDTLDRVQATGIHFVDAYLASLAKEISIPIASFDRDFGLFFKDVKQFDPMA
jgi:predicted nucleic acid-binding protein